MALWKEWLVQMEEKFWREEELREERNYLCLLRLDQRNNDISF